MDARPPRKSDRSCRQVQRRPIATQPTRPDPGHLASETAIEYHQHISGCSRRSSARRQWLHRHWRSNNRKSPRSSSSWPMTSATGTSAPITAAGWTITHPTSIASPTRARSSQTIMVSNPAPPAAPRSLPVKARCARYRTLRWFADQRPIRCRFYRAGDRASACAISWNASISWCGSRWDNSIITAGF